MKLYFKFLIIVFSFFASFTYAEKLTQEKYDFLLNEYMTIIQNSKAILDDDMSQATSKEKSKVFCERIKAYENIKKISEQNKQLENASNMWIASNYYLDRQNKSLQLSGISESTFCKTK